MKKSSIILLILISSIFSFSQTDTATIDRKSKNRFVIWFIPSAAKNIYGIAIGPIGSEAICNRPYTKYSHGLNIQIPGQGFFQAFYLNNVNFQDSFETNNSDSTFKIDTIPLRTIHNGILVSPLGTFTPQVNGLTFSLFMSMGQKVNGLSFNLFWNLYNYINGISISLVNTTGTMKGMQVGLVNKSANLRGIQFGLWNKNEKRSLPILNWNFKGKGSVVGNGHQEKNREFGLIINTHDVSEKLFMVEGSMRIFVLQFKHFRSNRYFETA